MNRSFQHEIPKARVNITLDIETNGSQKSMELPMKLLVLGEFSQEANNTKLDSREKISLTKDNLNSVIEKLSPKLALTIPNHLQPDRDSLKVELKFKHCQDFHPDNLVMQIPMLKKLIAMRNLLKELKAHIIDDVDLRKQLEKIIRDKSMMKQLHSELNTFNGKVPKEIANAKEQ